MPPVGHWPQIVVTTDGNKMLSYRSETALQGALVMAKSGRLELGDNVLRTL